jgi:hypothetical protein
MKERGFWMRRWSDRNSADRKFCIGILIITLFASFMTAALVKAAIAEYSFTKYEYHKLMQNTCLMGEKTVDAEGSWYRVIVLKGVELRKDGKVIGTTHAFFGVKREGDRATLNIYSEINSNGKTSRSIIIISDTDIDGKPDREGDGHSEMHDVTEDGKIHWNVWIVRFIEEVINPLWPGR